MQNKANSSSVQMNVRIVITNCYGKLCFFKFVKNKAKQSQFFYLQRSRTEARRRMHELRRWPLRLCPPALFNFESMVSLTKIKGQIHCKKKDCMLARGAYQSQRGPWYWIPDQSSLWRCPLLPWGYRSNL